MVETFVVARRFVIARIGVNFFACSTNRRVEVTEKGRREQTQVGPFEVFIAIRIKPHEADKAGGRLYIGSQKYENGRFDPR